MGPPDRRRMQEAADAALEHLRAGGAPSAVLLIDLDRLCEAGQPLRAEVAELLATALRPDDLVARFGGDVFVIVAREVCDESGGHALARRLKQDLDKLLHSRADATVRVHASIGVSMMREQDLSSSAVVSRADAAMYAAKNQANRAAHAMPDRPHEGSREALVEAAFECTTIEDFDLYYRPIADLRAGSVAAVEAILRWEHPDLGTIHPAEFIPLARRLGQIVTLGRWAIEKACAQTVRWAPARDGLPMRTYVTVSPEQLADPAFTDDIEAALAHNATTGHRLALQFSEEALAAIPPAVVDWLVAARIDLILVDAGAGGTSPASLGAALSPVATIRIARPLISEPSPLLGEIAELASKLELRAIANGVQTRAQLQAVIAAGVPLAQGPLFSRPQSASAIEQLVYRERPFATLLAPRPAWLDLPEDGDVPTVEVGAPAVP